MRISTIEETHTSSFVLTNRLLPSSDPMKQMKYATTIPQTVTEWDRYIQMDSPSECFSSYWLCHAFVETLTPVLRSVEWATGCIQDSRYSCQLRQFYDLIIEHTTTCQQIMSRHRSSVETIIQESADGDAMASSCQARMIDGLPVCGILYQKIMEHFKKLLEAFFFLWVHDLYYIHRLLRQGRLHKPRLVDWAVINCKECFQDLGAWELVCSDEQEGVLIHPLLPHPSDFLVRRHLNRSDRSYAQKARFEYSFKGSLERHTVVFVHTPSLVPKLLPSVPPDEVVPTMVQSMPTATGIRINWCSDSHRKGRRKKWLSQILKESRKKKSTREKQKRRQWCAMNSDDGDDGDDGDDCDDDRIDMTCWYLC